MCALNVVIYREKQCAQLSTKMSLGGKEINVSLFSVMIGMRLCGIIALASMSSLCFCFFSASLFPIASSFCFHQILILVPKNLCSEATCHCGVESKTRQMYLYNLRYIYIHVFKSWNLFCTFFFFQPFIAFILLFSVFFSALAREFIPLFTAFQCFFLFRSSAFVSGMALFFLSDLTVSSNALENQLSASIICMCVCVCVWERERERERERDYKILEELKETPLIRKTITKAIFLTSQHYSQFWHLFPHGRRGTVESFNQRKIWLLLIRVDTYVLSIPAELGSKCIYSCLYIEYAPSRSKSTHAHAFVCIHR